MALALTQADLTSIIAAINNRAKLASPEFTVSLDAPTPAVNDISLRIVTTEFVKQAIEAYFPQRII